MKKLLAFLMAMTMLFAFIACNNDNASSVDSDSDGDKEVTDDIWNGVEGDELEFALTVGVNSINVVLNRDGSCYTYLDYGRGETINGEDLNHPELDGEISIYSTNYGSFEEKDGEIVATLDAQTYYRFVASGKDADALKDAFFETNMSEDQREGYYGKGVVMFENKGSNVLVCRPEGDSYVTVSVTNYDENNVKTTASVVNEDGTYQTTSFYPDGTVSEIESYDAKDNLVKRECYNETGTLEYAETVAREEGRSVTTRTDAEGKVIKTTEYKNKTYENGGRYLETTTVENGVTTYHNIVDEKCDADGVSVSSYSMLESIEGNRHIYNVNYTDHKEASNNYTLSKETVDGVLTNYYCAIERVTVVEDVEGRQSVRYIGDGQYRFEVEYIDKFGDLTGRHRDYPAGEYVHGDWETFEYVIE